MTKTVRVENADTSSYKVQVEVWEKSTTPGQPDHKVEERVLSHPTAMLELGIHSHRYLIVKEHL